MRRGTRRLRGGDAAAPADGIARAGQPRLDRGAAGRATRCPRCARPPGACASRASCSRACRSRSRSVKTRPGRVRQNLDLDGVRRRRPGCTLQPVVIEQHSSSGRRPARELAAARRRHREAPGLCAAVVLARRARRGARPRAVVPPKLKLLRNKLALGRARLRRAARARHRGLPARLGARRASNYGELLAAKPVSGFEPLRGKWVLVTFDAAACDAYCEKKLYFMRQVRRAQGKDMDRIERLWVLTDAGEAARRSCWPRSKERALLQAIANGFSGQRRRPHLPGRSRSAT